MDVNSFHVLWIKKCKKDTSEGQKLYSPDLDNLYNRELFNGLGLSGKTDVCCLDQPCRIHGVSFFIVFQWL